MSSMWMAVGSTVAVPYAQQHAEHSKQDRRSGPLTNQRALVAPEIELVQWSASNVYMVASCLRNLARTLPGIIFASACSWKGPTLVEFDSANQKFAIALASCCCPWRFAPLAATLQVEPRGCITCTAAYRNLLPCVTNKQ